MPPSRRTRPLATSSPPPRPSRAASISALPASAPASIWPASCSTPRSAPGWCMCPIAATPGAVTGLPGGRRRFHHGAAARRHGQYPGRFVPRAGIDRRQAVAGAARRAADRVGGARVRRGAALDWRGDHARRAAADRRKSDTASCWTIALPQVEKRLRDFGGEPASSTPERITEKVRSEIARWSKVIAEAGIPRQ